ncbi:MAG: ROK family protein [Clostridia bacterium]
MIEYIGVDIGGTNIRVGAIDENEEIIYMQKESTIENVNNSEELYLKILNLIKNVPDYEKSKAIGIGVPGAISREMKIMTARNIPYLKEFPLVERLEKDLNKKVYLENDAKVATLAQAIKGCGKNYRIVCYITLSTGVGGGVVIDKKIFEGSNNVAGYFSRMILDGENIAENLLSGTALVKKANEILNDKVYSSKDVFEMSNSNSKIYKIVENFKRNLTNLLLNIAISINPDIIILGGGVTKSCSYFISNVKDNFYLKTHSFAKNTKIEIADLDEPGVLGAALLGKKNKC